MNCIYKMFKIYNIINNKIKNKNNYLNITNKIIFIVMQNMFI